MEKGEIERKKGFTLVETMLVLAIAGLIFLMMFIAIPALNRTQRDSRRRDDISIFLRRVKDYQTNNRGALPTGEGEAITRGSSSSSNWSGFYYDYLGESFNDPSGDAYKLTVADCGKSSIGAECSGALNDNTPFPSNLTIFKSATCDGGMAEQSSNPRKIAVQYRMEGGGVYCANT